MVNIKITAFLSSRELCDRLREEWCKHLADAPEIAEASADFHYELDAVAPQGFDFKEELDAEAIIARGSTANDLRRRYAGIPVCEIPYTTVDVLNTVQACQELYPHERIGIVGSDNVQLYFEKFKAFTPLRLESITIAHMSEMEGALRRAKAMGIGVVVGGPQSCRFAASIGLGTVELSSDRESMRLAIRLAVQSARATIHNKRRLLNYQHMIDRIDEGIICLDSNNRITMFNNYAANLLHVDGEKALGKPYESVIEHPHLKHLGQTKRTISDELILEKDLRLNTNKIKVNIRGASVGQIIHLQNITKIQQLEEQIRKKTHSSGLVAKYRFEDIKGESQAIARVVEMARIYAAADSNVLVEGRTGTGKELFAQSIHNHSRRSPSPFLAVNCAAIPDPLLESELFGYREGAFTGTRKGGKIGLFELAHKGTIFLDEIHAISPNLQSRLLRVIQEREIMRLGDDKIIPVDVRVISATNQNLLALARKGGFRDDLYFRLNILRLSLPELNERGEDILRLADIFIAKNCARTGQKEKTLSPGVREVMMRYSWPGNIRELQNVCERICVLCHEDTVREEFFLSLPILDDAGLLAANGKEATDIHEAVQSREREVIRNALARCANNKTAAAERLGMSRTTLWKKMQKLGIE